MNLECPTCGSEICHHRVRDDDEIYKVHKNGTVEEISSRINGYGEVYCSKDKLHEIPSELMDIIIDLT